MSSSSSNNMEEDAWLMKIELKREEPAEAVKGDESKEATIDQPPVFEQALPIEEEEEDVLKPYYVHLTPNEIEAFRIIETVHVQNKYLTRENILHLEHIPSLRSKDWRVSWSLRTGSLLLHHHHLLLNHQKKMEYWVWALPLAFAKLGGGAPIPYNLHYLLPLLS